MTDNNSLKSAYGRYSTARRLLPAVLAFIFVISGAVLGHMKANAQDVTRNEIVNALSPLERLKERKKGSRSFRGIGVKPGKEEAPSIDLKVQFNYNEATLVDEAKLTLSTLAAALEDDKLANMKFDVIGHTDAKGERDYNMDLSRRRALAVVLHLEEQHGIDIARLRASGEGEERLALPNDPESGENRRVEIRTITQKGG